MTYESESRDLAIALTGDSLLTRRIRPFREEPFLRLRELLAAADIAFTNFESCARQESEGAPTISIGTYATTRPELLGDLRWLGFGLVSAANNHVFDWGEEGVLATIRHLDAAGLPNSGAGRNLREAARPVYVDTPRGRVALISANSFAREAHRALNQRADCQGKPGVNVLGFHARYVVDRQTFDELRRAGAALGFDAARHRRSTFGFYTPSAPMAAVEYEFLGATFVLGDGFEVHTEVNERDAAENLRQIREARREADWVLFSLHNHEVAGEVLLREGPETAAEEPADFMVDFAHRCVDEGADVVVGHGPHFCLGLEVYRGRPILYSLGNFIMQNDTVEVLPSYAYERFNLDPLSTPADFQDARSDGDRKSFAGDPLYWEAVVATCRFVAGELAEVSLYPVDLGFGRPRSQRGRPLLADEELGTKILSRMARLSRRFGTRIELVDGRGMVAAL